MTGERPWDIRRRQGIIAWLESPEGEEWSYARHYHPRMSQLMTIKDDDQTAVSGRRVYLWVA